MCEDLELDVSGTKKLIPTCKFVPKSWPTEIFQHQSSSKRRGSIKTTHRRTGRVRVRANIHLGGQTEFCPNGERKLFVTWPRQGEKIIMNYCRAYFLTVVE